MCSILLYCIAIYRESVVWHYHWSFSYRRHIASIAIFSCQTLHLITCLACHALHINSYVMLAVVASQLSMLTVHVRVQIKRQEKLNNGVDSAHKRPTTRNNSQWWRHHECLYKLCDNYISNLTHRMESRHMQFICQHGCLPLSNTQQIWIQNSIILLDRCDSQTPYRTWIYYFVIIQNIIIQLARNLEPQFY